MTTLALVLILGSASLHAYWNLMAKRLPGGSEAVWLFTLVAVIAYAPLAVLVIRLTNFTPTARAWVFMLGTGALQMIYFTVLRRGYAVGDLSVVYPLARGTGPLVATVISMIVIGERPSPLTITGAVVVALGAFLLARPHGEFRRIEGETGYGLLTGMIIGCYTAWDGYGVSAVAIPALIYDWAGRIGLLVLLTPIASGRRSSISAIWRSNRWEIVGIGILSSASYIMVLTALSLSPISSIAPAREISIVIGTIMGVVMLGEAGGRRVIAATVITFGVLIVAVG